MHRHPYFDLLLHDDEELLPYLGSSIAERVTVHEWPLSCVQRLTLADGRRLIYKAQAGPTIESDFYARARSGLLPKTRTIHSEEGRSWLLIEYIDAPLIEDLDLPEAEVARVGREVLAQIVDIQGDLPYLYDITEEHGWKTLMQRLVSHLRERIDGGSSGGVSEKLVRDLEHWASSKPVLAAVRTQPGYVHRDLTGDNLFVLADGYRLIDWQRPILGPADLDLITLFGSLGFDPLRHVSEGALRVWLLLQIDWFRDQDEWIVRYAAGLREPRFVRFGS